MRPLQNQMGLKKKETRYTIMFYYATEFSLYPQKHIFHNKTVLVAALTALVNCFVAVSLLTMVTHMFLSRFDQNIVDSHRNIQTS